MNPYAPPGSSVAARGASSAAKHLYANAALQGLLAVLHTLALLGQVVLAARAAGPGEARGSAELFAHALWVAFVVVTPFWTVANVVGLVRRRPWARVSTAVYWGLMLGSCVLSPVSLYGLWTLVRRDDVRELFGARRPWR